MITFAIILFAHLTRYFDILVVIELIQTCKNMHCYADIVQGAVEKFIEEYAGQKQNSTIRYTIKTIDKNIAHKHEEISAHDPSSAVA